MPTTRPAADAPDVAIIGGGIVGASAAVHLAALGRRVVLVEREAIAAGASGRNSGVVQHPFDPVLVALHLETIEHYRTLEAASDGAFRLGDRPAGLLSVTHDPAVARHEAAALAATHPGLSPMTMAPAELRELEPSLAPDVAACRLDIGYPVGPARATVAMADEARRRGADLRIGQGASPWRDGDRISGVRLADGRTIPAGDVIVAAGPWSPALADPTGRWRPIVPRWGVVVRVDLRDPPRHVLEESGIEIEPGPPAAVPIAFSLVTSIDGSAVGSTFLPDRPDPGVLADPIVERAATFVPAIATAPRIGVRACARPVSLDGRPLVGPVPGVDGLWIAAGHGPWGISTGPASGRMIADLVTGRASVEAALDPARRLGPLPA